MPLIMTNTDLDAANNTPPVMAELFMNLLSNMTLNEESTVTAMPPYRLALLPKKILSMMWNKHIRVKNTPPDDALLLMKVLLAIMNEELIATKTAPFAALLFVKVLLIMLSEDMQ